MSETPPKPVALEAREAGEDGRRFSPSVARNREPIRDAFAEHAARQGRVLEIASGTGEHGAFLTDELTGLEWTYSDVDEDSRVSQAAWVAAATHDRLHGPLLLDASLADWGAAEAERPWDAVVSINMVHIAPMGACLLARADCLSPVDGSSSMGRSGATVSWRRPMRGSAKT